MSIGLTVGTIVSPPPLYEGRAVVFLSKLYPGRAGIEMDPFVSTFQSSLTFSETTDAVSKSTGVPALDIALGTVSSRANQGTIVSIVFKGSEDPEIAARVPREAALATLRALAEQDRALADSQVKEASSNLQATRDELAALDESTGFADLDAEYENQRRRLAALRADPATSAQADAVVAQLAEMSALRSRRDVLLNRLDRSEETIAKAESDRQLATARLAAVETPGLVKDGGASPVSRTSAIARGVVGSTLVTVVGTLGGFALLDWRKRRRAEAVQARQADVVGWPPGGRDVASQPVRVADEA
ncbi:MAG TPA: transmembrane domain-containing protein [Acidimicrobiales bacterium]|nr:transmembrane domain-containing protein [Acidimicrobiales bacterium]